MKKGLMRRDRANPPKAKVMKENQNLRVKLLGCQLQLEKLNRAWEKKFSLLAGIFEVEVENAATIGELRRWYAGWKARLDAIDPEDPQAEEKMQEIFDEYELELQVKVEPDEMAKQED